MIDAFRRENLYFGCGLVAILCLHAALSLESAWRQSPAWDEIVYPAAGYDLLVTGRVRLNDEHPPLAKVLTAFPLLFEHARLRLTPETLLSDPFYSGFLFVYDNAISSRRLILLSRLSSLIFSLALGTWLAFLSRSRWGPMAGIATAFFYALCPSVLTHASAALLEMPLAFFCIGTVALYTRWIQKPTASAGLGWTAFWIFSLLTKLTALLLAPALLLGPWLILPSTKNRQRVFLMTCAGLLIGVVSAEGVMRLLHTSYWHAQTSGRGLSFFIEKMPVYFNGQILPSARWFYAPLAWWMKMPVPLPILAIVGFVLWHREHPDDPLLAIMTLITLESLMLMLCIRSIIASAHYFLLTPICCLFIGVVVKRLSGRWTQGVLIAAAITMAVGIILVRPSYRAYFNGLVGGATTGSRWLWDSDQDWGQDLPRLAEWMRRKNVSQIILSYSGAADPRAYGIRYQDLLSPAIITRVYRGETFKRWEGPQYVAIGTKVLQSEPQWMGWWLHARRPAARIGGTFFVYDITHDAEAKRWLTSFYTITHRPASAQSFALLPAGRAKG